MIQVLPISTNNFDFLTLEFDVLFEIFNYVNNIWIVSARALIFHMNLPCDKIYI